MEKNINLPAIDKRVIVEGWDNYKLLSEGDWVVMGCYPDEGCNKPTEEGRERAFSLLQGLYEMLEPFRESVVSTYEEKKNADHCFLLYNDEWIECANFIIREYEIQSRIKDMTNKGQKLHDGEGVTLMGGNARSKNIETVKCKTLDDCLTDEIKNAEYGIEIFKWTIENLLMEITPNGIIWKGTHELYGFFVDKVSEILDIRGSNDRIPWRKFRFVLNHEKMLATAKQKVQDYKNNGENKPEGFREIMRLLMHLK